MNEIREGMNIGMLFLERMGISLITKYNIIYLKLIKN